MAGGEGGDEIRRRAAKIGAAVRKAAESGGECRRELERFIEHISKEKDIPSLDGCFSPEFRRFIQTQHKFIRLNSGRVYNTCRAIEGPFMELIERAEISGGKKQWALGPFNPIDNPGRTGLIPSGPRHGCLKWLDGLEPGSVVLVSFGTTTTFPRKQIHELAIGLENSGQKFVWVLRDADVGDGVMTKNDDIIALPEGFEGRVEGRGLVVREWAPQVEILGHEAVGGFVSHCGWNSCMESISMGVPMGAWPMHSDQPRNAVLVTKVLGVGITVREWARRDEIVGAREVEQGVRRLMGPGEGAEVRRRAAELGRAVREAAAEEGGPMRLEWDSFISHITR
ncbi:UDP-glycosyltransferase 73B4 [Striga hermonthica]|uniref:UDP-glycosyltransferase 73B4 n=1 Tax=Striga hermonthica TaxID=68872 RepID=A0A9N7MTK5_STRHE|nr:UDP-glycosyltransferase 73B4 [Striga hermonthica]